MIWTGVRARFGAAGQRPDGWGTPPVPPGRPEKSSRTPLIVGMTQLVNRTCICTGGTPVSASPNPSTSIDVGARSATGIVQKYFYGPAASGRRGDHRPGPRQPARSHVPDQGVAGLRSTKYSAEIQADSRSTGLRLQTSSSPARQCAVPDHHHGVAVREGPQSRHTGLTVNGVAVPAGPRSIDVFPGRHALGTTCESFAMSGDTVIVESLGSGSSDLQHQGGADQRA